jgi:hypothetical protein
MRDFLDPINAAQVNTELGPIYVVPAGRMGIQVHAPHLTVDGVPFQLMPTSRQREPSKIRSGSDLGAQRKDDSSPVKMPRTLGLSTDMTPIW